MSLWPIGKLFVCLQGEIRRLTAKRRERSYYVLLIQCLFVWPIGISCVCLQGEIRRLTAKRRERWYYVFLIQCLFGPWENYLYAFKEKPGDYQIRVDSVGTMFY